MCWGGTMPPSLVETGCFPYSSIICDKRRFLVDFQKNELKKIKQTESK